MALSNLPTTDTGVKSISDLYDLINGQTTTQSGGSSTTTTNSGISQESMNSMLQSILEGNQGLAAVSSGQRAAGGYGSSVNTLLTNDLLTRAASQVAQQNKTSTVTTTQTPVTKTVGGISPAGLGKTGGLLAAVSALGGSKGSSGLNFIDSLYSSLKGGYNKLTGSDNSASNFFGPNAFAGVNSSQYSGNVSDSITSDNSGVAALNNPSAYTAPSEDTSNSQGQDTSNQMMQDTSNPMNFSGEGSGAPAEDTSNQQQQDDPAEFADGGMVRSAMPKYADGGNVTKKSTGVLAFQANRNVDPRTGLQGRYAPGVNEEGVAQGDSTTAGSNVAANPILQNIAVNPGPNLRDNSVPNPNAGSSVGGNGNVSVGTSANAGAPSGAGNVDTSNSQLTSASGGNGGNSSGGISRTNISDASRVVSQIGSLMGNSDVNKLGTLGSMLSGNTMNDASGMADRAMSGDSTRADVSNASKTAQQMGSLLGNANLGIVGKIGGIMSSGDMSTASGLGAVATGAAFAGLDAATGGIASKVRTVYNAITSPTAESAINTLATLNPVTNVLNNIASIAGVSSLGQLPSNIAKIANPDSYAQMRDLLSQNPESAGMARAANESDDPLGTLMGMLSPQTVSTNPVTAAASAISDATSTSDSGDTSTSGDSSSSNSDQNAGDTTPSSPGVTGGAPGAISAIGTTSDNSMDNMGGGENGSSGDGSNSGNGGGGNNGGMTSGEGRGYGPGNSAGTGEGGSSNSSGGSASAADGGEMEGPGGPIGDKIHAMLSDGEYVLSADTVKAIGVDTLDKLQDKYHTPAAVQKLRNYGK